MTRRQNCEGGGDVVIPIWEIGLFSVNEAQALLCGWPSSGPNRNLRLKKYRSIE